MEKLQIPICVELNFHVYNPWSRNFFTEWWESVQLFFFHNPKELQLNEAQFEFL